MSQPFPNDTAQQIWQKLVAAAPIIHCLTSDEAKKLTADALLAAGATPAMIEAEEECSTFTQAASGLLIHIGTLHHARLASMRRAARTALRQNKAWVLDPTDVGDLLSYRNDFARELLAFHPAVIHGNAAEILWLVGQSSKRRDNSLLPTEAETIAAAHELARKQQCVILLSGERDYISDGNTLYHNDGGDSRMTRVNDTGCALSALVAACCAIAEPLLAAATASRIMKNAGNYAASAGGMGSFAVRLLDGLTFPQPL
ncbi:MAG: hydroxyethylthiazole kinase [Cardiobacteriaceae bacterium]|nr:hydroxyethylthiazole kinase [Cardiobacteriaceae bacterium]